MKVEKFSISMSDDIYQQVLSRKTGSVGAGGRSSVISRDLDRLYNGLLKQGLKTLQKANFTLEERACLGTLLGSTPFLEPSYIPLLVFSVEDSVKELRTFGVDPESFLAKIRVLDTAALYALVDALERDMTLAELG